MLSSIKEKLLNVKKNVNIFNNETKCTVKNSSDSLNHYAGAHILSHFQDQWVAIHETNENNAKETERLAGTIENISKKVTEDKENITLITHTITNTNLTTNITNCLTKIKELHGKCASIEDDLIKLENVIDAIEFERMKKQHTYHLEQYKIRKKDSLELLKTSFGDQYNANVEKSELHKKRVLEERQRVFQEAFKSDLEVYKNLGTIPKVDVSKKQSGALLEEIQLDYDQNELDQFFGDNSS